MPLDMVCAPVLVKVVPYGACEEKREGVTIDEESRVEGG